MIMIWLLVSFQSKRWFGLSKDLTLQCLESTEYLESKKGAITLQSLLFTPVNMKMKRQRIDSPQNWTNECCCCEMFIIKFRIWHKFCLVSSVKAAGDGLIMWGYWIWCFPLKCLCSSVLLGQAMNIFKRALTRLIVGTISVIHVWCDESWCLNSVFALNNEMITLTPALS